MGKFLEDMDCKELQTTPHLVGALQNVQQGKVQLLGIAVGQGLLEQPCDGIIWGGAAVHILQIQPCLPNIELLTLLPAQLS